jgi:hypothetical protein
MKRTSVLVFVLAFFTFAVYAGGPADKATGSVVGPVIGPELQEWWHSFDFAAHEGDTTPRGKGSLIHHRLNDDGSSRREEICEIIYVIVEGADAWFAGPVIYDSTNEVADHWIIMYVADGGQPGAGNDVLSYDRVANGADALLAVTNQITPEGAIVVRHGNLKVHSR